MNKSRRRKLENILFLLGEHMEELEGIRDEEQEAFDNMPESLQNSEKGDAMTCNVDEIDSAIIDIQSAVDSLNNIE